MMKQIGWWHKCNNDKNTVRNGSKQNHNKIKTKNINKKKE